MNFKHNVVLEIIDKRENEISDTLYDAKLFFASMKTYDKKPTHSQYLRSRSSNVNDQFFFITFIYLLTNLLCNI